MKKIGTKVLLLILGMILIGLVVWNLTDCATVSVDGQTAELSFADSWSLRTALIPKEIQFDGAGCPFYTDYSVRIGGLTHCIATDGCEMIWIKELNLHYSVSKEAFTQLDEQMLEHWSTKIRPAVSDYTFATFEKQGENGYKMIDSEISSLYTFDSLRIRPAMEWAFEGDWLYRIVLNPDEFTGQDGELEILFGEKNLSLNGKVCTTAEGVSYENVLKWVTGKYQYFDYEPETGSGANSTGSLLDAVVIIDNDNGQISYVGDTNRSHSSDDAGKEMLDCPVNWDVRIAKGDVRQKATIHSIVVEGPNVTFRYTYGADAVQEPGEFGDVKVVLTDGTVVAVSGPYGVPGDKGEFISTYMAAEAIPAKDIDYIKIGETIVAFLNPIIHQGNPMIPAPEQ